MSGIIPRSHLEMWGFLISDLYRMLKIKWTLGFFDGRAFHRMRIYHGGPDIAVAQSSIKLIAGRTGQEFNRRKIRKGAFWEDRYHATAVEDGDHLMRCLVYIDLNMVRAGFVKHPDEWPCSGYSEIQEPKRKNVLINYEKLRGSLDLIPMIR